MSSSTLPIVIGGKANTNISFIVIEYTFDPPEVMLNISHGNGSTWFMLDDANLLKLKQMVELGQQRLSELRQLKQEAFNDAA